MNAIQSWRLLSCRTCTMRGEPDTVVLALTYGEDEVLHLYLSRAEFARLARQMAADALILASPAEGPA